MSGYHWLMHPQTAEAVTAYRKHLATAGLAAAGAFLRAALAGQHPGRLSDRRFLEILVNTNRPRFCAPAHYAGPREDFSDCRLYSLVAWDPVSWPGNDFWAGARVTDDGVKAAASDLMRVITGQPGAYDRRTFSYRPPEPYPTWEALAQDQRTRLRLDDNLQVLG